MNNSDSQHRTQIVAERYSNLSKACREWEQRQRDGIVPLPPRKPSLWWNMVIDTLFRKR